MAKDVLEEGHSANLAFGKVSGIPSFLFSHAINFGGSHRAQVTSVSERGMAQIVCSSVERGRSQAPSDIFSHQLSLGCYKQQIWLHFAGLSMSLYLAGCT